MAFVPLEPCALRLGLFIKIEGSWFSHPFPTNSFKINAAKDLETLRGLKKVKLFVDIERSDSESSATPDLPESSTREQLGKIVVEEPVAQDDASSYIPLETVEAQLQRKVAQLEAFHDYQSHLQQVENQFQEVLQESKQSVQDVVAGRPRGCEPPKKSCAAFSIC